MQIKKDDFIGHLKTRLAELVEVTVRLPGNIGLSVCIVPGFDVNKMLNENPHKRGVPEFASIENGDLISVFPRTDKRYRLRVFGTQYIQQ